VGIREDVWMSAVAGTVTAADLPRAQELLAQAGSENFTVANALLGAEARRHLMAIYGYARLVDDVGDEVAGDRLALLGVIDAELDAIYAGAEPTHPVMRELASTITACHLPAGPFRRLIEANRMDQTVTRYETFAQLLEYCQLSAAPVGELVLGVFGAATRDRIELSDRVCAGLQIAEHLQDIAEDHGHGRIYLPAEDRVRFGCDDESLSEEPTAPLRALIAFEARRARSLLAGGAPLPLTLPLRPRIAVAGFIAGGRAALDGLPGGGREGGEAHPRGRARAFAPAFARAAVGR
jgi:squalene synthase HpnC